MIIRHGMSLCWAYLLRMTSLNAWRKLIIADVQDETKKDVRSKMRLPVDCICLNSPRSGLIQTTLSIVIIGGVQLTEQTKFYEFSY